jgi:hypothetical protein
MTVFDIEDRDGVWFEMEGGGRVKLKALTVDDWKKINKATVKHTPIIEKVDGKPQLFEREITDRDLQTNMINDLIIQDWENFLDKNENPIPCTIENKNKLLTMNDPTFRDFVDSKIKILNGIKEEQKEAEEKN